MSSLQDCGSSLRCSQLRALAFLGLGAPAFLTVLGLAALLGFLATLGFIAFLGVAAFFAGLAAMGAVGLASAGLAAAAHDTSPLHAMSVSTRTLPEQGGGAGGK